MLYQKYTKILINNCTNKKININNVLKLRFNDKVYFRFKFKQSIN